MGRIKDGQEKRVKAPAWDLHLRRRGPKDWRVLLNRIEPEVVRLQVAGIVWWDFFGGRMHNERWPHLDDMLRAWRANQNASMRLVRSGLVALGYPQEQAAKRTECKSAAYQISERSMSGVLPVDTPALV